MRAVALGALTGAVAIALFLHLPVFIFRAVPGPQSLPAEASRAFCGMLGTAFASPWDAIGALAGGAAA